MRMQRTSNSKLHPHKFMMWVTVAAICMMFAGLTSAYIVKKTKDSIINAELPSIFYWSTFVILLSSLTMQIAVKNILAKEMYRYRSFLGLTALLGVVFAAMQTIGFYLMEKNGTPLTGIKSNAGASFILIIVGIHAVHVLGGVVALVVMYLKNYFSKTRNYSAVPAEVMATYWHFVDILWIYLLVFLVFIR